MKTLRLILSSMLMVFVLAACGGGNPVLDTEENRCSAEINPNAGDMDSDGIINQCDLDNDNDLVNDDVDNCPLVPNADQLDTVGTEGGLGDACDPDGDEVESLVDNCPTLANVDQLDSNSDGLGDACDTDNDGIENPLDNCPLSANVDQLDTNGDGVGDFCDRDNDSIRDAKDNCPLVANKDQLDENANGLGDVCDVGEGAEKFGFFEPLNLSDNPGLTFRPSVAFDKQGYIHVVWDDNTGIEGALEVYYTTVKVQGFTETTPVKLSNTVSDVIGLAQRPRVAIAPDGIVHVVWQDTKTNFSDIFHIALAFNEDTEKFEIVNSSESETVNPENNISNRDEASVEPSVAIDDSGNIYVAWSSNSAVYVSHSTDGGKTFSTAEEQVSFTVPVIVEPALFAEGDGQVSLVWTELDKLKYTKSTDHATNFETPRTLATSDFTMQRADVEVFGENVYICWDEVADTDQKPEVFLLTSNDGGTTFNDTKNISNNSGTSIYGALKVGPTGDIFISWSDTTSGNYETEFSHSEDGGETFSQSVVISPSENGSLVVDMDVDDNNNVVVVWDDNRYESFDILMAYGATNLPVISDLTDLPDFFDPSSELPILISAALSDRMQWEVEITDSLDRILFVARGLSTSINVFWDGTNLSGELVETGTYQYSITAANDENVDAISKFGSFRVNDQNSSERNPVIESLETDREAFSPNFDGRTDTVIANAVFNQTLNWEMELRNSEGVQMTSEFGFGPSGYLEWDGLQENGYPMPEGTYTITAFISNEEGQTAEASVDVIIDLTPVVVENLTITPVNLSEGTPGNISFHITESAVVTIYIFDESGFTTVNELVRTQLGGGVDGVEGAQDVSYDWDGTSGNGILQPPGKYTLRIWVRDFGANLPVEYPFIREIEIIE